jgi:membrane-associated phospholipid phosphatase
MTKSLVLLLVLTASTASAEPTWKLPTAAGRKAADVASYVTLGALLTADTVSAFKADDPKQALMQEGARLGMTYGAVWLAKTLVHRKRPCAPDCGIDNPNASFFSGHTAGAFAATGGMRLEFSLPLAVGTGGLRVVGGKHWVTDAVFAAAVGAAAKKATSKWIRWAYDSQVVPHSLLVAPASAQLGAAVDVGTATRDLVPVL